MSTLNTPNRDAAKIAAGKAAADLIADGMVVGLGTGSTAMRFIESLIERCHQGLKIIAVATSIKSLEQAKAGGIPIADINSITSIAITVDGADEIDPTKRMIKGGGGALLREKIIANMSKEMVVVVDENKLVKRLGACPLPVEVVPFAITATIDKINQLGYNGTMRCRSDATPYITDNGNYIYDIHFRELRLHPEEDHNKIRSIPGVVDTGFFFHLAGRVIVGHADGKVEIRS